MEGVVTGSGVSEGVVEEEVSFPVSSGFDGRRLQAAAVRQKARESNNASILFILFPFDS